MSAVRRGRTRLHFINRLKQGWPVVLSSLKSFLETGRGLDVFAKPKAA